MIGIPCQTTLFCDFDGPIIDVSDRYYATYCQSLQALSRSSEMTSVAMQCRVLTKEQFWCLKQQRIPDFEIALRSGVPQEAVDHFLTLVRARVNQPILLHHDCLQPGIRWALELMYSQGIRLVLVTLRRQSQVYEILKSHNLEHLFKAVWGTQDLDAAYVNSADRKTSLLQAAWHYDCVTYGPPQRAWMIGDTEADILAGQAQGISTVALTCGIRSAAYLRQYRPDYVCEDLVSVTHSLVNGVCSAIPYNSLI